MAMARNDAALADAIEQRTRLYRQGLPYRQPPRRPSPERTDRATINVPSKCLRSAGTMLRRLLRRRVPLIVEPFPGSTMGDTHLSHAAGEAVDQSLDQKIMSDSGGGSPAGKPRWRQSMTPAWQRPRRHFRQVSNSSRPADGPARTYWVWAICGFLLLAVGLVFGQTLRHEFIRFDDDDLRVSRIRTLRPD